MKNKKQVSAILSADLHIRPDIPICRTDNFFLAMEKKIDFIINLAKKHDCPWLIAGDLGHKPLNNGWPVWLLKWIINKFENTNIICIAGQHDLENHRISNWDKSGIGVLHASGAINFIQKETWIDDVLIHPFSYGQEIRKPKKNESIDIAMTHQMIVEKKDLFPDQNAIKSNEILKKYPEYSLILSGDNHTPFVSKYKNRLLVNPGSMMRTTTAQENHKPRVYLWYSETNEVKCVYLPIEKDVVSRDHIKEIDERSHRYDSFVQKLKDDIELELSFSDNMSSYFKKYRTEIKVKDKILKSMED